MQGESEEHRIFVGGIRSADIDDEYLRDAFSRYGPVFNVSAMPNRGFGSVSYYSKQHAENAINYMNGQFIGYWPIHVGWTLEWPRGGSRDISSSEDEDEIEIDGNEFETVFNETSYSNRTVYFGGLTGHITRELIEHIFSSVGGIEEITVFEERGYAFICFDTKETATLAICLVNGRYINDKLIKCSWSHRPNNIDQLVASSSSSAASRHTSSPVFDHFESILNRTSLDNCTVYCGEFIGQITEELIQCVFSPYGEIEKISLDSDYAFIRFSTKVSAALAISAINNAEINGETVRCNWSHRSDNRSPETEAAASSSIPDTSSVVTSPPEAASAVPRPSDAASAIPRPPDAASAVPRPPKTTASSASLPKDEPNGAAKAKGKNPDLLCKICMDEELGVVFLPCGHLTSCSKCAEKINLCPMCRKRITGKVRTFLS